MEPFIEAVENIKKYYSDRHVCMFKQAISVPGIAQRLGFANVTSPTDKFFLFNKRHADLVTLFRNNNTGGPSLIFNRFSEAGSVIFNNFLHKSNNPLNNITIY